MMMRSEKYLKSCIDEYVSLINTHRGLMEILLFRAQGSSLEHFRENYTDRSTELVKAWFASMQQKHPEINTAVSDFSIHLHTVWMFTLFEEVLMHSVPQQEMETILHDYILFEICIRFPNRKWKPSCTTIFFLKFKAGGQSSKYEIQTTYIRTFNRIGTVGKEEIFTEVSSFFYEHF